MTQEAMKLALDALISCELSNYGRDWVWPVTAHEQAMKDVIEAITAIKEVLAQPEQEPVGQLLEDAFGRGQVMWFNKPKDESMLYTTPPQRTEQNFCSRCGKRLGGADDIHTCTPPQEMA